MGMSGLPPKARGPHGIYYTRQMLAASWGEPEAAL